jgi:hypothetical protein
MATTHWANTNCTALVLAEVVSLEDGEFYRPPHGALSFRVLSGSAWITSHAEDHVLETGDPLLISFQPLRFELRKI